jgi:phage terminase small subunit
MPVKKKAVKKTSKRGVAKKATSRSPRRRVSKKTTATKKQSPDQILPAEDGRDVRETTGLTGRMAAFVDEYLIDGNGTQAVIRTGCYSTDPRTAEVTAHRLLRNPKVAAAIKKAQAARAERINIQAERVLLELARIAVIDPRDLQEWDEETNTFIPSRHLTRDQAAVISGIETHTTRVKHKDGSVETRTRMKLKTHDKVAALKEIGKHLGIEENLNLNVRDPNGAMSDDELKQHRLKVAREIVRRSKGKKG